MSTVASRLQDLDVLIYQYKICPFCTKVGQGILPNFLSCAVVHSVASAWFIKFSMKEICQTTRSITLCLGSSTQCTCNQILLWYLSGSAKNWMLTNAGEGGAGLLRRPVPDARGEPSHQGQSGPRLSPEKNGGQ